MWSAGLTACLFRKSATHSLRCNIDDFQDFLLEKLDRTRFPRASLNEWIAEVEHWHEHLAESHHLSIPVRLLANDNHCFVFPVYGSNVQDADADQAIRLSFRRKLVGTKGDGDLNRLLCRCLCNRLDECLQIVVDAEPRISTKAKAEDVGRSVLLQELKQVQSLICIGACVAYEDDLDQTLRSERKVLGKAKVADTTQTGNVNQKLRVKLLSVLVLVSLWSLSWLL